MADRTKEVLIWGAGKIGRGFLADLFHNDGYGITFVDNNQQLVDKLNDKKIYNLYNLSSNGNKEKVRIDNFTALNVTENEKIASVIDRINLFALVVFPNAFDEVAKELAPCIAARAAAKPDQPLDILLCTNFAHPAVALRNSFLKYLPDEAVEYFTNQVGVVECLVIRMAVQPDNEMITEDELVVLTNGYPELLVDRTAFKGELPSVNGIVMIENIRAEEERKLFTYNMLHALYSYIGKMKGYEYVFECTQDPQIQAIAVHALNEVGAALMKEYGYSASEMEVWNKRVLENMANPVLNDLLNRVGGDPIRKLKRQDRLTGAALLCRKNGIMPYYLAKAIAHGFLFESKNDAAAKEIIDYVKTFGLKEATYKYCQIEAEPELVQLVYEQYIQALQGLTFEENEKEIALIKEAYSQGFFNEKTFKGCAQCTLKAMFDLLDEKDDGLFQSASGLSGGMAICNDGSCGGYVGGILLMSKFVGRKMDQMLIDGDKVDQYKSFTMAQSLHDIYLETYGTITCKDIHKKIFGESFYLRDNDSKNRFEEAGAHREKCTTVIASASAWITRIMLKEGLIKI